MANYCSADPRSGPNETRMRAFSGVGSGSCDDVTRTNPTSYGQTPERTRVQRERALSKWKCSYMCTVYGGGGSASTASTKTEGTRPCG